MWVDADITCFVRHSGRRRLLLLPQGWCTMGDGVLQSNLLSPTECVSMQAAIYAAIRQPIYF